MHLRHGGRHGDVCPQVAGGHNLSSANLSHTLLVRWLPEEQRQVSWSIDARPPNWGSAESILLQPYDVVYVPKSARDSWNDVVGAIAPTVGVLNSAVKPLSMFGFGEDGGGGGGKSK